MGIAPHPETARRRTLALVLAGSAVLAFQGGLVRVALPAIRADLDTDVAGAQLIGLAALVVVVATLVPFGKLADLAGAARMYGLGLAVLAAGSVASAAAPGTGWLVGAQAVQGIGWSMCSGSGPALLVATFPEAERGRVLAVNHMAVAVGLASGPSAGGLVVSVLGWRWAFALFAPVALVPAVLVALRLGAGPVGERRRLDLRGSALLAAGLVAVLLAVELGSGGDLGAAGATLLAVAAAGALWLFARVERDRDDPVVDLSLLRDRRVSAGLAATFLTFVAMASNMFLVPFFLQENLGYSAARAGAVMTVVPAVIVLVAPLAGLASDRIGPRVPATLGLAFVTAGIAAMARFTGTTTLPAIVSVLVLYGAGAGLFQSPNTGAVLGAVPPDGVGSASGSLAMVGRLGLVAGIAVAGGVWRSGLGRYAGPGASTRAFRDAFVVCAVFGALATAASWARGHIPAGRRRAGVAAPAVPPVDG